MNISQLGNKILDRMFRVLGSASLRPLGFAVVPLEVARPCAWGTAKILGSFPPPPQKRSIGTRDTFFIHEGYSHRDKESYFDDTKNADQSQLEVYRFAREICERDNVQVVCDVGCGSAYKLMKFMSGFQTIGVDVPKTCQWLRQRYPDRRWVESESAARGSEKADLVIAADVIEHVLDPDQLMALIKQLAPRLVVLSTPDRDLLRAGTYNGPPSNSTHIREWNFDEFDAYVGEHFEILEHFISCAPQATQCVLCRPRA